MFYKLSSWGVGCHSDNIIVKGGREERDRIAGKFDKGILYMTLPKKIVQINKESDNEEAGNDSVKRA